MWNIVTLLSIIRKRNESEQWRLDSEHQKFCRLLVVSLLSIASCSLFVKAFFLFLCFRVIFIVDKALQYWKLHAKFLLLLLGNGNDLNVEFYCRMNYHKSYSTCSMIKAEVKFPKIVLKGESFVQHRYTCILPIAFMSKVSFFIFLFHFVQEWLMTTMLRSTSRCKTFITQWKMLWESFSETSFIMLG